MGGQYKRMIDGFFRETTKLRLRNVGLKATEAYSVLTSE